MKSALACLILLLAGCSGQSPPSHPVQCPASPPPPKPPTPPKPILATQCVEDWYATAELPDCVRDWVVELSAQQKAIAKKQNRK